MAASSASLGRVRLEGHYKQALETGRNRLLVTAVIFVMTFVVIGGRMVELALFDDRGEVRLAHDVSAPSAVVGRADVVDRNGIVLATSLPTSSLYANPTEVLDAPEAARKLVRVLPELSRGEILAKLFGKGSFVWLRRNLTPKQQYRINALGIPGIAFQRGERRVYPQGRKAAHVLGYTDIDGQGIAGLEKKFDQHLRTASTPLRTSIDIRIQAILREELTQAITEFRALGAAGVVYDVTSGEVMALVSLPDFDPNVPGSAISEAGFNRVTKGVYEMGSTFKLFTTAMALDSGTVGIRGGYDASKPIRISRFTISDYHAKNRWLSVPEILVYSSNIGAAKMALDVGTETQKLYLGRFGLLRSASIELPEVGAPLVPSPWRPINTMTIAYGHGIAVSPLRLAEAVGSLVNGGIMRPATLLKQKGEAPGKRILSEETSRHMRGLMRLVVRGGTGRKAKAVGYRVGGKTGTAEKQRNGRYRRKALISSFVGAFPMDAPRFVVLAAVDEPKGNKKTFNYATGGWVAAPVVGRVIGRLAPLARIAPVETDDVPMSTQALLASLGAKPVKVRERRRATN